MQLILPLLCAVVTVQTLSGQSPSFEWNIATSPVKTDLTRLEMLSPSEGFAVGTYLLQCREGVWSMMPGLPWTSSVNAFQLIDRRTLYAASLEPTNESFLYRYDGALWRRTPHPMANFITAISLNKNGRGWLGGWGELAYTDGRSWRMYPPPPGVSSVHGIIGSSDRDLQIFTGGMGIYRFEHGSWKMVMPAESLHAFKAFGQERAMVIRGSTVIEYRDSKWTVHSSHPMLRFIVSLYREPNGTVWGTGAGGLLMRFRSGRWERITLPVTEQLNDLSIFSGKGGTIVGKNGTILSLVPHRTGASVTVGFRVEKLFISGKGLDGEYGAAIEDVNEDGKNDLYTVNLYNPNLLFINHSGSGGLFRDETVMRNAAGGIADTSIVTIRDIDQGIGVADLDNDGDRELLILSLVGHNNLLLNTGKGFFFDVSHQKGRGTFPYGRSNSVCFADVENDGDLDMFIANESSTNRLFLNNGDGYFSDATGSSGLETERGGVCSVFGDIDGDGKSDLVVTNWTDRCRMYRNVSSLENGVRFVDITERSGIGGAVYERSNGAAFGDIDNDGDLDLFIAKRRSPNKLFRNDGNGRFADISREAIGTDTLISYGVCFADMDNDGWLDLYLTNVGANRFYRNEGDGRFSDKTFEYGIQHSGYNTGSATGDADGDGDIDLYSSTYINGESVLFINNLNDSNFVTVRAEGTLSNRDAVGAVVRLYEGGKGGDASALLQHREVTSGSGYASHSALEIHFGADRGKRYDITVRFPASGITRTAEGVMGGTRLILREEDGYQRSATLFHKFLERETADPRSREEVWKFLVMLLFSAGSVLLGERRGAWDRSRQIVIHAPAVIIFVLQSVLYFYERSALTAMLPLGTVLVYYTVVHLYHERVVLKRTALLEKENTRNQIARDLHDDIASTLSSATIYLNVLQHSLKRRSVKQNELMKKINEAIGSASDGMTDIVWAVSPKHDTLGALISRIRIMIAESASAHSLVTEFHIGEFDEQTAVSPIARRNIYLIFKEGMNNIRKHAQASSVSFSVRRAGNRIVCSLKDDGCGFTDDQRQRKKEGEQLLHGNGVGNMKNRAEEIGAEFRILSGEQNGTTLQLSIEMMQLHH